MEGDHNKDEELKNKKPERSFISAINNIVNEISAIRITLDNAMDSSVSYLEIKSKEFSSFVKENSSETIKNEEKKTVSYKMEAINAHKLSELIDGFSISVLAPEILANAMFVSLISRWEAYFIEVLRLIYSIKPEVIDSSDRSISFAQLASFSSMEEARESIIQTEVESIMRDSHTRHFDTLNKYLKKSAEERSIKDVTEWKSFIEITERRNIIVHADGVYSKQYLEVCKQNSIDVSSIKLGDRAAISKTYMHMSCDTLTGLAIKLGHYIWRKYKTTEKDRKDQDGHFIRASYALIRDGRYRVAENVIEQFLADPKNKKVELTRKTCFINLAQACKWAGNDKKCAEVLKKEEWSSSRDNFRLALLVLSGQFQEASRLMTKMGAGGDVAREDYDQWPLFKEFRQSENYREAYRNLFGEDVTTKELSSETLPTTETPDDVDPATVH